jgi:hypothetical protein
MLQQIFFLTSGSLTAYQFDGRTLTRMNTFVAADAGLAVFDDYLQKLGQAPTYILTDMVEEDFRVDSIAHTLGGDRKALLARHVARVYRGTEYRHAQVLGRDPNNKRKDEVLFSGLLNPEFADMWIGAMQHYKVPIAGIYSLPLVSIELVKRLWNIKKDVLLITHHRESGLRQSFISGGKLRFSRLTPVPDDIAIADYAHYLHAEIGKTKRYLSNLHLLGRDVILDVCVLSGGQRLEGLEAMRDNETLTHYRMVSVADASAKIGYHDEHTDFEADELFAFLLAKHHRHNHYANDAQRFHYKMAKARQALSGLCVAASVAGLLWAGTQIVDGLMHRQQLAKTTELLATAEARYNEVQSRLPQTEVAPEDMRLAVAAADQLRQQRYNPHELLARLGHGLQRQPNLQINQIDWFVSSDRNSKTTPLGAEETQQAAAMDVAYDEEGNPIESAGAEGTYQIGIVEGRVQPFEGNFSRAHEHIADLLNALRSTPGVITADALELPLNTATSGRVLGSIGDESSKPEAPFTLRLVLGANHG